VNSEEVIALVLPEVHAELAPTLTAIGEQSTPPADVLVPRRAAGLAPGPPTIGSAGWIWLVEAGVVPRGDALARLLEGAHRSPGRPVLVAGRVLSPSGQPDRGALPIPAVADPDLTVEAFDRRLLSLRACPSGSFIVERPTFDRFGLPSGGGLEWTGRVLRDGPGFLEPASVALRAPLQDRYERARTHAGLRDWARLLAGDALDRREKPWFAFRLAEQATQALPRS